MRLQSTQLIDTAYETPPEPVGRPTMLLKAVLLAMFNSDTTRVIVGEIKIAFNGMGVPIVVILRSQELPGMPLS